LQNLLGLSGPKCNKILGSYESIVNTALPKQQEKTLEIWRDWKIICELLEKESLKLEEREQLEKLLIPWGENFKEKYQSINVTPYIHIIVCHTMQLINISGSIGKLVIIFV
jgi:hypothetical protein